MPRLAGMAFDRLDQGRLFAADVGPRPAADGDAERPAAAENVVAQQPALFGLGDGVFEDFDGQRILVADVDESFAGADGVGADEHAFEDGVRIAFQHRAVHVGAGLAFVGVADDVFQRRPSAAGRAAISARWGRPPRRGRAGPDWIISSMTSSGFICVMRPQGPAIGAAGDGFVQRQRIDRAAIPQNDFLLPAVEIQRRPLGHAGQSRRGRPGTGGPRRSRDVLRSEAAQGPLPAADRRRA